MNAVHHHEAGSWWAESPDVAGWYAAGDSRAEVVQLAKEGIPFALDQSESVALEHIAPAGEHTSA